MTDEGATRTLDQGAVQPGSEPASGASVGFGEALRVWLRIGCLSFGGPAGQIALMHREIVEERRWLPEHEFLNALNFCMLLPGPEAMQLATFAGWRLHGTAGGLAAGLLFVLPGALVVLALTLAYLAFGAIPLVEAAFVGIKAAVLVIVLEALLKISRRALHRLDHWLIAGAAFLAIFFFAVPFPLIVLAAALVGMLSARGGAGPVDLALPEDVPLARTLRTAAIWLGLWLGPLAGLAGLGSDHVLTTIGVFFSKLAVVTFGGAYAVLAYMGQAAVETHGWLAPGEMLDGLGLAETTPGPLILVTQFVGFLAAAREAGDAAPWAMGLAGAGVTLWVTFTPCFLWIFTFAPYVAGLARSPRLRAALQGITAAVVGVILNLSLWFALHVFFPGLEERHLGPLRYWASPGPPDILALVLALVAALALFRFHQGVVRILVLAAALAMLARTLVA